MLGMGQVLRRPLWVPTDLRPTPDPQEAMTSKSGRRTWTPDPNMVKIAKRNEAHRPCNQKEDNLDAGSKETSR